MPTERRVPQRRAASLMCAPGQLSSSLRAKMAICAVHEGLLLSGHGDVVMSHMCLDEIYRLAHRHFSFG